MDTALPPITLLDQVDSTNDLALEAARHHAAPHGSCWLADQQVKGRGRRELTGERREWFSPPGANLYLSLLLRNTLEPSLATPLTLAAAVGAHAALSPLLDDPSPLWIKWPNDLYFHDKKLGGILSEGVLSGPRLDAVIVGIGLNINLAADQLPEALAPLATSLLIETGQRHDRLAIALSLRHHLLAAADTLCSRGLPAIIEAWRPHDRSVGRQIEAMIGGQWRQATSRGISDSGGLLVELPDGTTHDVQTGEVRFVR